MTNATPEQIRLYRHRCRVLFIVQIVMIPVWFISVCALLNLCHNGQVAIGVGFGSIILVFIGFLVFRYVYFRCPVCKQVLPSGPRYVKVGEFYKGHCDKCWTDYAA